MAEENKINGLAWFVAGLGVGALVGILYAPKSGRETRENLINGAKEGTEYLRHRSRQAAEQVGDLVEKGKEHVGDYVDRGRAQWEEFVERGKNLVAEQTGRVSAAVEAGPTKHPPSPANPPSFKLAFSPRPDSGPAREFTIFCLESASE